MKKFFGMLLLLLFSCNFNLAQETEIINPDGIYVPPKNKFMSFFSKKKTQAKEILNIQDMGYEGFLPNLEQEFQFKKESAMPSKKEYSDEKLEKEILIDAPFSDPLFLDVIIKQDSISTYVNELFKIKETLEKLRICIIENKPIQMFNANVNILDLQTKALEKKYANTSYAQTSSYYSVLNTNYNAKLLGNLKYDSNFYSRYMPISDTEYSPQNVSLKSEQLLNEIEQTLYEIGNAK